MWSVIDFFSGAGGMSCGFAMRGGNFEIVRAVNAQFGKPSCGKGKLQCNSTYRANIGVEPMNIDLAEIPSDSVRERLELPEKFSPDVMIACPPCTGFSRANPKNHSEDDARNGLVVKSAEIALHLRPKILLMENARELIRGNFRHHFEILKGRLESSGYRVSSGTHMLNRFGLPQVRERAIVIAVDDKIPLRTLEDLWLGYELDAKAVTVETAIRDLNTENDAAHVYPAFKDESVRARLEAIPKDGGSWLDLARDPRKRHLLTGAMRANWEAGRIGSYPDVYGRMAWDRPAPTIKRECGHIGNGRYAHPDENRLCSVREMAVLNGFPRSYRFQGAAISNLYRHIGDAVPPVIAYQLALVCEWMFTGRGPNDLFMPDYHLDESYLERQLVVA